MAFNPVIPEITKAYENDPRTKIAQALMQQGGSTAPVAAGKYAWVDGLARALQGVAGGYITKQQQKKFKTREDKYMADMQAALTGEQAPAAMPMQTPAAGTDTPSMVETRNAIRPSMAPLTQVDPNDFVNGPPAAPQTPPMAMPQFRGFF